MHYFPIIEERLDAWVKCLSSVFMSPVLAALIISDSLPIDADHVAEREERNGWRQDVQLVSLNHVVFEVHIHSSLTLTI